MIFLIYS
jgi:ribonuclease HI